MDQVKRAQMKSDDQSNIPKEYAFPTEESDEECLEFRKFETVFDVLFVLPNGLSPKDNRPLLCRLTSPRLRSTRRCMDVGIPD